jgi:hypothetical protein
MDELQIPEIDFTPIIEFQKQALEDVIRVLDTHIQDEQIKTTLFDEMRSDSERTFKLGD